MFGIYCLLKFNKARNGQTDIKEENDENERTYLNVSELLPPSRSLEVFSNFHR